MKNQTDRILREQAAIKHNLVQLERLRIDKDDARVERNVERAIENLRDAITFLEQAVDVSKV